MVIIFCCCCKYYYSYVSHCAILYKECHENMGLQYYFCSMCVEKVEDNKSKLVWFIKLFFFLFFVCFLLSVVFFIIVVVLLQIQVSYYSPGQYPSSGQQYRVPQPMSHQVSYPAQRTQPMPQPTQQSGQYILSCSTVIYSTSGLYAVEWWRYIDTVSVFIVSFVICLLFTIFLKFNFDI